MPDRVIIFDTTLRDGEQSPGCSMNVEEKVRMALQLERLGVDVVEAGFPIASEGDFEGVRQIAGKVRAPVICGLGRCVAADIDTMWEALKGAARSRCHVFLATSDIHLKHKLKKTPKEALAQAVWAVEYARKKGFTDIEFSPEDAARTRVEFLAEVTEAVIRAGAGTVNIPDTVGYAIPDEFGKLIRTLITQVPNAKDAVISVHCHDDLGLAVANSLAAVQNGARQVECTVNGIGERAGNASLEEVVMALNVRRPLLKVGTNVRTEEIYRASRMLVSITGMQVQRNKAIVGENAFAHEAGIHQDGVLKEATTYEIMTPQSVGVPTNQIVLGKHSGRHALRKRYQALGYELNDEELVRVYKLFTHVADLKKAVYDEDLLAIVQEGVGGTPEAFALKSFQVMSGTGTIPTATVELVVDGGEKRDSGTGDGPVDAIYRAIDRLTQVEGKLLEYTIQSATKGEDAIGEVHVNVAFDNGTFSGRGASTDILEASARAYLNAINRATYKKRRTGKETPPPEKVNRQGALAP